MNSAESWAGTIRFADKLRGRDYPAVPVDEPTLLVQRLARNPVLCGGPIEHFSKDMPVWHPKTTEEERLRPIDVLYRGLLPRDALDRSFRESDTSGCKGLRRRRERAA